MKLPNVKVETYIDSAVEHNEIISNETVSNLNKEEIIGTF